jgi:hypothetical protein
MPQGGILPTGSTRPAEDDRRTALLTEIGVGEADDRCVGDRRMLVQHVFDFAGVHVVPAPNDHVLRPSDTSVQPLALRTIMVG